LAGSSRILVTKANHFSKLEVMNITFKVPNVDVAEYKRTKILATIGPSTNSYEAILELIKAGANGLRLNFSHGTEEERVQQIKWIREASNECGKPVAIVQDLQGPKIRLGDFEDRVDVRRGQVLRFKFNADYMSEGIIPTQYDLATKVKAGEPMYLYDGKVQTIIKMVREGIVYAEVENDSYILKRKGINLPDTDFGGDILTAKDKKDIAFGSTHDVDYVALSFVQRAGDVHSLRRQLANLNSDARIIAKIETRLAVENLEDIIKASDAVMVARGDLAIETATESVPIVQRKIIGLGQKYGKPTIVATQMLASMTDASEPTRAEVSDVASAVIVGADCVMLSEETASGSYPIEAVKVMKRVILYTQNNAPGIIEFPEYEREYSLQGAICGAVIGLAQSVQASLMIVETKTGSTAMQIAARRAKRTVIAVTSNQRVAQQLVLVYGTLSYVRPVDRQAAAKMIDWMKENKVLKSGDIVVTASGREPGVSGTTDTIRVRQID
jgi:pyruvate kinase